MRINKGPRPTSLTTFKGRCHTLPVDVEVITVSGRAVTLNCTVGGKNYGHFHLIPGDSMELDVKIDDMLITFGDIG